MFHAFEKARVERAGLGFEHAAGHFNTRLGQTPQALPRHLRVRVLHGSHHPRHTGVDQRFGTGRRAAMVAARLQGDVGAGTAGTLTGLAQGMHFGMRLAGAHVPAFADHFAVAHDHAAYTGLGWVVYTPLRASSSARAM